MTDMKLVRTEVSAGGVGAELFWFHDLGYFEEFLGHKSGLSLLMITHRSARIYFYFILKSCAPMWYHAKY